MPFKKAWKAYARCACAPRACISQKGGSRRRVARTLQRHARARAPPARTRARRHFLKLNTLCTSHRSATRPVPAMLLLAISGSAPPRRRGSGACTQPRYRQTARIAGRRGSRASARLHCGRRRGALPALRPPHAPSSTHAASASRRSRILAADYD